MSTKTEFRQLARQLRQAQPDKDRLSQQILARTSALPLFEAAKTVLWYVHVRDEVRTLEGITNALQKGQKVIVPYCVQESLRLFWLTALTQLVTGKFGILEPIAPLREQSLHLVSPAEIELALIPGVAFDRQGNRLGHGAGYYDRLLAELPPATKLVGLAFACQVFPVIPSLPHDVRMDWIVTEQEVIETGK